MLIPEAVGILTLLTSKETNLIPTWVIKRVSIDDVYALIVGQKTHLEGIEAQLKDIKESLEFTQKTVEENKEQISALQQENAGLKREVSDLSKKMEKLDIRQEADERRSREWSVRIYGIKREQNEDTRKVISELISGHNLDGIATVKRADTIIEHCHRLRQSKEQETGKPPGIIVRFHSRPQRYKILREAKIKINRSESNNNIFMVEDLTASDHALKKAAKPQMRAAHLANKKVSFWRGRLYIDSVVTPINFT